MTNLKMDLDIRINSSLEGRLNHNGEPLRLINGFMPFQWEGVKFLANQERAAYFRWDTGTGKTVIAEAAILMKRYEGYDLSLYVVKPNNLEGARRKLKEHTGIEGYVLDGTPKQREKIFLQVDDDVVDGKQPVMILNAEKFSVDTSLFIELITGRSVLLILDEAAKFGNRKTILYRKTCEVFFKSKTDKGLFYPRKGYERPSKLFSVALSATPITKSPDNLFNTVRLLYPGFLGSVSEFNNLYAGPRNKWNQITYWRNLDHLAKRMTPIVHQVSKNDPEISSQFPKVMPSETIFCSMDKNSETLYSILQKEYSNVGLLSMLNFDEILAAIGCFQMIASNPRAVLISAQLREDYERDLEAFEEHLDKEGVYGRDRIDEINDFERRFKRGSEVALKLRALVNNDSLFTDKDSRGECINSKLVVLRELLEEHDGKAVVFTTEKVMQDLIAEWLEKWNISYVVYHGGLTQKMKTQSIDWFRYGNKGHNYKVFLSTDAGQDSIDLPESSLTIHYDYPWSWSGIQQRENRQHRIDSSQEFVRTITLTVPNTVEDRKVEIIEKKYGYHRALFEGQDVEAEGPTRENWLFVLTGDTNS